MRLGTIIGSDAHWAMWTDYRWACLETLLLGVGDWNLGCIYYLAHMRMKVFFFLARQRDLDRELCGGEQLWRWATKPQHRLLHLRRGWHWWWPELNEEDHRKFVTDGGVWPLTNEKHDGRRTAARFRTSENVWNCHSKGKTQQRYYQKKLATEIRLCAKLKKWMLCLQENILQTGEGPSEIASIFWYLVKFSLNILKV